MKFNRSDLLLYAVTDRSWLQGRTLTEVVRESLEGGVTFLQLREKALGKDDFLREAIALQALCREYRVPFVVNDDVDIALAMDADGVHVGQSDMEAGDVRQKLGPNKILGVSAQTVEQAVLAEKRGADYLGVGAVFPTGTKSDADDVDFETLQAICHAVSIPVVAIGGISRDNVEKLRGSGICGVAVVSAIFAQKKIRTAAGDLKKAVLKTVRPCRGVIFDMDGVVLDSMGIWRELGLRQLASRGVQADDSLIDILFSMSMEQAGDYLHKNYLPAMSPQDIVQELMAMVEQFYLEEVQPKPGIEQVLHAYRSQNIPMIVLTSSPRSHITAALKRLGLLEYFTEILTTSEIGESKHSPLGFRIAAEKLGTAPAETVVWEDSLYALLTAKKDGFQTVGVRDDLGEPEQTSLREAADLYLNAPIEYVE